MASMTAKMLTAILVCCTLIAGAGLTGCVPDSALIVQVERTYATDADFEEGVFGGVETRQDELHLCQEQVSLPFMWVPNDQGTVSKVDTETGAELGRYRVVPYGLLSEDGSPSRTTVDLEGNVWVGLRTAGTVVKIGLCEAGSCIDRNGDGIIQTSQDLDGDGDITGGELLGWGEDECVLLEVVLVPGREGAYLPGTYEGPYDTDYWGTSPRSLAVDAQNNLWAGTGSSQKFYYVDGDTGEILDVLDVSPWEHSAYGATIDRNGVIWSVRPLLCIDPASLEPVRAMDFPYHTYGLTPDYLGHLFVTGGDTNRLYKIDIESGEVVFAKDTPEGCARGVAVTASDNHVWVADSCRDSVLRYDNGGNLTAEIEGLNYPSGVAVDVAGKVWVSDMASEYIHRIDPETDMVDLSKRLIGTWGHYSYGALTTGIVSTTVTEKTGTWTTVYDTEQAETPWGIVSWTGEGTEGTLIEAEVRSSHDASNWSTWETAENGVSLTETPAGRYLEIKVTLQTTEAEPSPVLYDLTAQSTEAEEPVSGCFVASAAYGTTMADEVDVLRQFRDGYLVSNVLGRAMLGVYYRVSPPMAEFIARHPGLKPFVRIALVPAVVMSSLAVDAGPG